MSRHITDCAAHLKSVTLDPENFPSLDLYPFNLRVLQDYRKITFDTPVTIFCGENGTGKSTFLEALTRKCGVHIWRDSARSRVRHSPYEDRLHEHLALEWTNGPVCGSFFGASIFQHFADMLDEWASADPGQLEYFGGKSLITQSHGQSLMSFFKNRYKISGLYFLDEPETGLSPLTQLELLDVLTKGRCEGAQFIIATHSPILLACPKAVIYTFDETAIRQIQYEQTSHYRIYKRFMDDRSEFLK